MEYTVKVFSDPEGDGDFIAEIEELKGCSAFGSTPEEALQEVETVMRLWIETAKKYGKAIPKPKSQITSTVGWLDASNPILEHTKKRQQRYESSA